MILHLHVKLSIAGFPSGRLLLIPFRSWAGSQQIFMNAAINQSTNYDLTINSKPHVDANQGHCASFRRPTTAPATAPAIKHRYGALYDTITGSNQQQIQHRGLVQALHEPCWDWGKPYGLNDLRLMPTCEKQY